jgi:hypothetical protein
MIRPIVLLFLGVLVAGAPAVAVEAADGAAGPAAPQAVALPDLWTVGPVKLDATADSALTARDQAAAMGRAEAWTKLYRRLTAMAQWPKQPQLDDNRILRLIRSAPVANERRSITRYVADVTYHFNPAAVRQALRAAGIPFTDQRSKPALIVPLTASKGFDAMSPWAMAWRDPELEQGLVPVVLPKGDAEDSAILSMPNLEQLDWAALMPLADRYEASEIVLASASEDGKAFQVVRVTPTARIPLSFAYAQPNYAAVANAVMDGVDEAWKTRPVVVATRATMIADVQFASPGDWAKIRAGIGATKSVADMDVRGLMLHEAEVSLTYLGRPEQLRDGLAQQNIALTGSDGNYTLALAGTTANAQ